MLRGELWEREQRAIYGMIFLGARFDRLGSRRRNLAETGRVKHRKQFANTPWDRAVYHATVDEKEKETI